MGLSSSKPESPFTMGVHVVPGSPVGETHALRALTATESLFSEYDGARTLYENFQRGVKLSRDLPCMGYRDQSKPGMPFVWQTYGEVATRVTHVGSALVSRGLRLKMVLRLAESDAGLISQNRANLLGKLRVAIDPGADGGAANGELFQAVNALLGADHGLG